MTRRVNQKIAAKRKHEELEEKAKAAKKAKKAEKLKEVVDIDEDELAKPKGLVVDRLVAGQEEAWRAHQLLSSGQEVRQKEIQEMVI